MTKGRSPAAGLGRRNCVVCGTEFQPYRANNETCSRKCYKQSPRNKEVQRRSDMRPERQERKNYLRRTDPKQVERVRAYNRKTQLARYGLTPELHDEMLAAQNGVCAICGHPPKTNGIRAESRLHADHDHVTGKARALLCNLCNGGIGRFRDDPALLRAAAEYIERHRAAVL